MKNIYTQYALIANNWVPNNPIKAFLPFIYNFVIKNKPKDITFEEISKGIEEMFDLHLSYYLLAVLLEYLRKNKEAFLKEGIYWNFSINPNTKIPSLESNYDKEINKFIDEFISFIGGNISRDEAEKLINSFFARYDYEIISDSIRDTNEKQLECNDYYVSEYIKSIIDDPVKSNFVLKIALGSIIKSNITSENLILTVFAEKKFYFDTKIIFRLLGYYGDYYKAEYEKMFLELHNQGAELYITEYVYNEALYILRGCEKHIENSDYEYDKASDILRYFRSIKKEKSEIVDMIVSFENILNTYNITVDREEIYGETNMKFNEDYNKIREIIVNKYIYESDEFGYYNEKSVETDMKSILHAYLKRKKNDIVLIKDAPLFFVTSNGTLVNSVMQYNKATYPGKISPIMIDTFLGVLIYKSEKKLEEYSKMRLLAFCNDAFSPTKKQREEYICEVEKLKMEGRISDDNYFLTKNYELIDEVLINSLRNNDFVVTEDTVFNSITEIQKRLVDDVTKSYESKIEDKEKKFEEKLQETISSKNKELETKEALYKQKLSEVESNYENKVSLLEQESQKEIEKFKNKNKTLYKIDLKKVKIFILIINIIIALIFFAPSVILLIYNIINTKNKWMIFVFIIATAFSLIFGIANILKGFFTKKLFVKKDNKLKNKYDIE